MKTIKMNTSENVISNSGKTFNIYKGFSTEYCGLKSKVSSITYTIRDEQKNELAYRKSKKALINFLNNN